MAKAGSSVDIPQSKCSREECPLVLFSDGEKEVHTEILVLQRVAGGLFFDTREMIAVAVHGVSQARRRDQR